MKEKKVCVFLCVCVFVGGGGYWCVWVCVGVNVNPTTLRPLTSVTKSSHLPTVGVLAALRDADEEIEEELSARAKGAVGGGLVLEVTGGLNGLGLKTRS